MATKEHCVLCGMSAAVRVGGTSFCSACGVSQYSPDAATPAPRSRRTKRAAAFAVFSSGLLVKTLLGAVALAAVGGVAATTVLSSNDPIAAPAIVGADIEPAAATTITIAPTTAAAPTTTSAPTIAAVVATTAGPVEPSSTDLAAVTDYVTAVQLWAECVSSAASAHSGGAFNPQDACGPHPDAADFGITVNPPGHEDHDDGGPGNSENAPGHDDGGPGNSENAPGHDDDGPGNSENAPGQTKDKDKDK